MSIDL